MAKSRAVPTSRQTKSRAAGSRATSKIGVRSVRFTAGEEELLVISYPVAKVETPAILTAAEGAVFRMLLEGLPNEQIAQARQSSLRTIANQVASIFKKLKVRSRAELHVTSGGGGDTKR